MAHLFAAVHEEVARSCLGTANCKALLAALTPAERERMLAAV